MDYKHYERKINDVILKCPIETGVEILAYNLLDSILEVDGVSLVDISRLWKDRDERLTTDTGISDMAILSEDFIYKTDKGQVYGFVEVKATSKALSETAQVKGQKKKVRHYLYTNGLVWKYYDRDNPNKNWEQPLAYIEGKECKRIEKSPVSINAKEFTKLIERLKEINWKE